MQSKKYSKGFTLIEVSVVTGIITILATVSLLNFHIIMSKTAVKETRSTILEDLYQARNQAINGYVDGSIGVHIQSGQVILFQGNSYTSGGTIAALSPMTTTTSTGSDIVFQRLTGNTGTYTTVTINGPENITSQITVTDQGIISSTAE